MAKKTILLIVSVICLGVLVASSTYLIKDYLQKRELDSLRKDYSASQTESLENEKTEVEVPVDFEKLKAANSDIYAWITIPGANVDYPIVQREDDNAFYLSHTIDGTKSVYGSIYTENYNNKDFNDFNTLVYGHNMKNGSMFGSLKKFRDARFFEENKYITVYMPGRVLNYEIFAACTWDNKHILANRNFDELENRKTYLDEIFAVRDINSIVKSDIKVTENDRIITLSTCMNNKEKRFIVSGILIYDSAED